MQAFVITFPSPDKARLVMYWQWDLRGSGMVWTNHINSIPAILSNLVQTADERAPRVPFVRGWGRGVAFNSESYDSSQDRLNVDYGVFQDGLSEPYDDSQVLLERSKERRRLERAVEIRLPPIDGAEAGWEVTVTTSDAAARAENGRSWSCIVEKMSHCTYPRARLTLRLCHSRPEQDYISVKVSLQRLAGSKQIRINGDPCGITEVQERDPIAFSARETVALESGLPDNGSILSTRTTDSTSTNSAAPPSPTTAARRLEENESRHALNTHLQRSYTTFLSFLQSPAQKWKSVSEIRRVSVSSYRSIDTTAVPVYKYEATFVNTSLWDIFSVFTSDGARLIWDRASNLTEFRLLNEVENDSSSKTSSSISLPPTMDAGSPLAAGAGEGTTTFWAAKWQGVWPVAPRDAVLLRTVYKSPTSIHVFYTSIPENSKELWSFVKDTAPVLDPGAIRVQYNLQAIAIDQISPTTTSVTVIEQVDPKGWSRSGYTPMAQGLAGIGEFGEWNQPSVCSRSLGIVWRHSEHVRMPALKNGAPPVITRLSQAKILHAHYSHDKDRVFTATYTPLGLNEAMEHSTVECVIRCDVDLWSTCGIALTVDPPEMRASALIRHRLSDRGSGCWITVEHSVSELARSDEAEPTVAVTVLTGTNSASSATSQPHQGKSRNVIWINGKKIKVEIEELKEQEVKELKAKKRIRNKALLLDQPLAVQNGLHRTRPSSTIDKDDIPKIGSAVASRPPSIIQVDETPQHHPPVHYALEGLAWLQHFHADLPVENDAESSLDWTILSYAENNSPIRISKKIIPALSPSCPLYRVERTFPNANTEQVARLITSQATSTRTAWDDRLTSIQPLYNYTNGTSTSVWIAKPSFPLRSRVAYVANARAQFTVPSPAGSRKAMSVVTLLATASFPLESIDRMDDEETGGTCHKVIDLEKLNPGRLSEGKVFLEGWILETVDLPQDDEDEESPTIEHTKCSFFTCSDLPSAGQTAFSMANIRTRLSKLFDSLETQLKAPALVVIPTHPSPALQIEGSLQKHETSPAAWQIKESLLASYSRFVASEGQLAFFEISVPRPPPIDPDEGTKDGNDEDDVPGAYAARGKLTTTVPAASAKSDHPDRKADFDSSKPPLRQLSSSTSLPRERSDSVAKPADIVLAEFTLQRDHSISSYEISAVASLLDQEKKQPLSSDPAKWETLNSTPFKLAVIPTSLPASQATRYLCRLTLPTSQYTSPIQHPLSSITPKPTIPSWFRALSEGKALLRIEAEPVKVEMQVEGRPASPLRVTLNGTPVTLASDGDVRALIAQRDEEDASESMSSSNRLSRTIAAGGAPRIPPALSQPRLVNAAFVVGPQPPEQPLETEAVSVTDVSANVHGSEEPGQRRMASDATIMPTVSDSRKVPRPSLVACPPKLMRPFWRET